MNKLKIASVLFGSALLTVSGMASTTPLPATFQGSTTDYISFASDGSAFPGSNLICFNAGCGGGFQAMVYGPGVTSPTGPSVLTSVWCVDYQLDVTNGSQYATNITTLGDINSTTQSNVRYGTLDGTGTPGWVNTVTNTSGIDGGDANSSAYRYTLAAALTSQYIDSSNVADPTNLAGGSAVNKAIQEAIWYVTYNNEYPADGTTWPPASDISTASCTGSESALNSSGNTNYACWVKYAEANAAGVLTNQWAVVSGPVVDGALSSPPNVGGYPSYQTFLVQVESNPINHQGVTPEPSYLALTFGLGGLIFLARRRKAIKQA